MDSEKSASCCSRICGARDDGANMPGRKKKKEEKRAKNGEKRLKTAKNGKKRQKKRRKRLEGGRKRGVGQHHRAPMTVSFSCLTR